MFGVFSHVPIRRARLIIAVCALIFVVSAQAIQFGPDFLDYTFSDLGEVPGLMALYGGLTLLPGNPDVMLIGGDANSVTGRLYSIHVSRDAGHHIVGFACTLTPYGNVGEYNDGGVVFGPGRVLFTARWPQNQLGQTRAGSTDEDRIDDLAPHGVAGDSSLSALNFVPPGFSGAGLMKMVTYSGGSWYTMPYAPDGSGSWDLGTATLQTTLGGGPEGFVYIDGANAGFGTASILVSELGAGKVAAYAIDGNDDPVVATRRDFLIGLTGAEGTAIDPVTGDLLLSTLGSGSIGDVLVVHGFAIHDSIFAAGFDGPRGCN